MGGGDAIAAPLSVEIEPVMGFFKGQCMGLASVKALFSQGPASFFNRTAGAWPKLAFCA